jgi:hypothetical protein
MTDTSTPSDNNPHKAGTVRAALASRDFRLVWYGAFASNIGTWMQNVVLPAYIYNRTGKASLVGLLIFAQLARCCSFRYRPVFWPTSLSDASG